MYIYAASVRCPIFAPTPNRAYRMSANLHRSLIYRLSLSLSLCASRPITLMIIVSKQLEEILYLRSVIRSRATNSFI